MPATKAYTRVNFENYPSTNTPLNETNLNKLDKGIDDLDDLLVTARNNIKTLQSNATADEANILALQGEISEINDNVTDGIGGTTDKFRFGTDGNGNYGYIKKVGGADTFFPFSSKLEFNGIVHTEANARVLSLTINDDSTLIIAIANTTVGSSGNYSADLSSNGATQITKQGTFGNGWYSSAKSGATVGIYSKNKNASATFTASNNAGGIGLIIVKFK